METTTNVQITIDDETADRIVICSLKQSIDTLKDSIKRLRKKKKLTEWEENELEDERNDLEILKKALQYYGGYDYS